MTPDPWALLREARVSVFHDHEYARIFGTETDPAVAAVPKLADLLARIDAALAGRAEGSTEDVVEWTLHDSGTSTARFNGCPLTVYQQDERWCWEVACSTPDWYKEVTSHAATEDEARRAATAAARGLR
jgi:hypothetical protein